MINRSIVLKSTEDRMDLYGKIDEACIEVTDSQDEFVFGSGDIYEKGLVNYHYWNEVMEDAGWIRLVDDFSMHVQYIDISVPRQEIADLIVSVLNKHVPVMSLNDLKAKVKGAVSDEDKARAYAQLGLGAQGDFDEEVKRMLESGIQSADEEIRTSSTLSIFLLKWPQFKEALEKAIVVEENMDLRAKMAYALAFCIAGGEGKSKTDDLPSW